MSKKKILILLEYVRVDHVKEDKKTGEVTKDFIGSKMGGNLKRKLKSIGVKPADIDIEYVYDKVPEAKQLNYRTKKPVSYVDPTLKQVGARFPVIEKAIIDGEYDIVIPTGKLGCKLLLGQASITKLRGVPDKTTITQDSKEHTFWTFPMYSMEFITAKPNNEVLYDADLSTLKKYIEEGDEAFTPSDTSYQFVKTMEEVREIFAMLKREKPVSSWDLETNTLKASNKGAKSLVISLSWKETQGVTIPMEHKDFTWEPEELKELLGLIADYVADPNQIKVLQNGQYDIRFLMTVYDIVDFEKNVDTKIMYYLMVSQEASKSFKLTDLAYEMTDMGGYDKPLEDWKDNYIKEYKKENKKVPCNEVDGSNFSYEWFPLEEVLAPYASGDTDCTLRIFNVLWEKTVENPKWVDLILNFYPRLTVTLARMESNGMNADQEYMAELDKEYEKEEERLVGLIREDANVQIIEEEKQKLYELGLAEMAKKPAERDKEVAKLKSKYKGKTSFNPNSPDDKGRLLFDVLGARPPASKETVKDKMVRKKEDDLVWSDYKTDKNNVAWVKEHMPEHEYLMDLFTRYSSVKTLRSTFVVGLSKAISNKDDAVHGSFNSTGTDCVSGDTLVTTERGLVRIDSLGTERRDKTFQPIELSVASLQGTEKASNFYHNGVNKALKITLYDGTEITTSYNHPLLKSNYITQGKALNKVNKVFRDKHIHNNSWLHAGDLTTDDYVVAKIGDNMYGNNNTLPDFKGLYKPTPTSRTKHVVLPKHMTKEFAEWLGMYTADGNMGTGNGTYTIGISNDDEEVTNKFTQLTKKVFNLATRTTRSEGRVPFVSVSCKHLGDYLVGLIGLSTGAKNKDVPEAIMKGTKEIQQAFIKGLTLDSATDKKAYPSLYLSSVSKNLMVKTRAILGNMGIFTKFSISPDARANCNTLYAIQITYSYLDKFIEEIGLVETVKIERLANKKLGSGKGKRLGVVIEQDKVFVRVKSIEPVENIDLFDLHVPGSHSFIGNGLVNHNTSRLSSNSPK